MDDLSSDSESPLKSSIDLSSDIEDKRLAREHRKNAFAWCRFGAIWFLCLLTIELTLLFLGKPPKGNGSIAALEVLCGITATVGILLAGACVRISRGTSSAKQDESSIPPIGLFGLVSLAVKEGIRLASKGG